jgi:hypothetical protein
MACRLTLLLLLALTTSGAPRADDTPDRSPRLRCLLDEPDACEEYARQIRATCSDCEARAACWEERAARLRQARSCKEAQNRCLVEWGRVGEKSGQACDGDAKPAVAPPTSLTARERCILEEADGCDAYMRELETRCGGRCPHHVYCIFHRAATIRDFDKSSPDPKNRSSITRWAVEYCDLLAVPEALLQRPAHP